MNSAGSTSAGGTPAWSSPSKTKVQQALSPAQTHLFDSCQGLVRSLAWKIQRKLPPWLELDDLMGYGQLGLAQAAKEFDPSRGTQFTTYAYYRIRGSIMDGLSQMSWFNRHAYHSGRYERMAGEFLSVDAEADPNSTAGENSSASVNWLAESSASLSVVYLASLPDDPTEVLGAGSAPSPELLAMGRETCQVLRLLIEALPDDAKALIKGAYYEGVTLQEMANRLGISKAWASRLHAKTLKRLARALRLAGAEG